MEEECQAGRAQNRGYATRPQAVANIIPPSWSPR